VQIAIGKYIIIYSVRNSGVEFHSDEMDVDGSIPSVPTTICLRSSVGLEQYTFNVRVPGSNPGGDTIRSVGRVV
jgi:hypothetical protein